MTIEQAATSHALSTLGVNGLQRQESKPPVMLNVELMRDIYQIASIFSASDLVPTCYRGGDKSVGRANCFVALSMGFELGIAPMQALTHIVVVNGRPAIDGPLAISLANRRAPIKGGIQYEEGGEGDEMFCRAFTIDKETGTEREYKLTIADAKAAGWFGKSHSHWHRDPKLMLRYRSAKYLITTFYPDAIMGMNTIEELEDIQENAQSAKTDEVMSRIKSADEMAEEAIQSE